MTSYFTFGQCHTHSFNGKTVDKDTIIKITAECPREIMIELFKNKWAFEYDNIDHFQDLEMYEIIEITR
jgi:hypothetical protein